MLFCFCDFCCREFFELFYNFKIKLESLKIMEFVIMFIIFVNICFNKGVFLYFYDVLLFEKI